MNKEYGIDLKWLAVTAFEIRCGNTTVVTDPYITECVCTDLTWESVEHCDIICLSHAHWDHITDIPRLIPKFNPIILCGDQTAMPLVQWLNAPASTVYPMYPNLELDFDDVKIKALYGRHTKTSNKGFNDVCADLATRDICIADPGIHALQPIGSMEYRNFLFTLPNGTKVLLWGNDPTVEQINLCKALQPDIGIIQRSVDPEASAKKGAFAAAIGCKVVIPHHHDFKSVDDPSILDPMEREFLSRVPDGRFIRPAHGQWIHL